MGDTKPATAPALLWRTALHSPNKPPVRKPPTLTPQFHWNLNQSALQTLTDGERVALYQLFRFYDSSFAGDSLPAIHCDRLVEILRDAKLLASAEDPGELQVRTVERVFAQAVLGKLRTYLDVDEQPALTFELFSGALLNCAAVKFADVQPPEEAFRTLVHELLTLRPSRGPLEATRGLVHHAEHAAIPTWSVHDLHRHLHERPTDGDAERPDYLHRHVFEQVLAGLTHDKRVDERLRERLDRLYELPEDVTTHFNAETVRYVTDRFRTFDVFDKGVLPRDEVFAMLSGMARKLEITDVYEVLAVILAGDIAERKQMPRGSLVLSAESVVKEVSLAQILQAIYFCRRSRSAAYLSAQQQQQHPRKPGGAVASVHNAAGSGASGTPAEADAGGGSKRAAHGNTAALRSGKGDKRPLRARPSGQQQHKQPLQGPPSKVASKPHPAAAAHAVASKRGGGGPTTGEKKKEKKAGDATLLRRLSKMSTSSSEAGTLHATDDDGSRSAKTHEAVEGITRQDSFRSSSSTSSAAASALRTPTAAAAAAATTSPAKCSERGPETSGSPPGLASGRDEADATARATAVPPRVPDDAQPVLTLRMFHVQRTNRLDGSVSLTLRLFFSPPPSRIVASQGVYFLSNGDRNEVWETQTHFVDARLPPEAGVADLKRLVDQKQRDGFVLVPEREQRDAIETLLRDIRDAKCPRYASALHSAKKSRRTGRCESGDDGDRVSPLRHEHELRRGALPVRPSLEHGSAWVRQKSAPLAVSPARPHREACSREKRRETTQRTVDYPQLLASWGLQPQDALVVALNDPRSLRGSHSLPSLPPPPDERKPIDASRPRASLPLLGRTGRPQAVRHQRDD